MQRISLKNVIMYLNFMHWFSRNCKPKNIPWLFTIAIDGKNCFAFGNRIFTTSFCLICSLKLYWFNFRPFHAHGHCVNLQRGNQNRIVHTTRIICEVTFFTHENFCLDARAKKLSWVCVAILRFVDVYYTEGNAM